MPLQCGSCGTHALSRTSRAGWLRCPRCQYELPAPEWDVHEDAPTADQPDTSGPSLTTAFAVWAAHRIVNARAERTQSVTDASAGWYPDPCERHERRYWDGMEWTGHVSDQGVVATEF